MNKLYLAAAGSGKTTFIVKETAARKEVRILITTFTDNNAGEIANKFRGLCGCVPSHVTVQTWFSFLLEHGVRPYQSVMFSGRASGLQLVNQESAKRTKKDQKHHYFNKNEEVYSDKIAKLVYEINKKSGGLIISRLARIYDAIYIDEVQDLVGFDLELIKLLAQSSINITMVGDTRQVTYHTHWETMNSKYAKGGIEQYINEKCKRLFEIDKSTLFHSYRNNQLICNFSTQLFPNDTTESCSPHRVTNHEGVFLVRERDVKKYLKMYNPVQLRDSKRKSVDENYPTYNYGDSKGKTFERVLIYSTEPMQKWLNNRQFALGFKTRCKFYVAFTRAIHSVAIVVKDKFKISATDVQIYAPDMLPLF